MSQLVAQNHRIVWDNILPGIVEIKEKTDPTWRPEDLYASMTVGNLHCFMPDPDGSDFVLLTSGVTAYSRQKYLTVLCAYSKTGDAVATFQDEIDNIARESGCEWVEFSSSRPGWGRHGAANGYEPVFTVYRRKLDG